MATYLEPNTFNVQNAGQPYTYAYDASADTMRFEVRGGDPAVFAASGTQRSEVSSGKHFEFGQTYTISYKFMIEPGATNTADWLVMGQTHASEDAGDYSGPPPFAVELVGEKMRVVGRYSKEAVTTAGNTTFMNLYQDSADIQRGKWYDMQITLRFDPGGNGQLDVWRDGVQIVDYNGSLGYNDQVGPYWKNGVYREDAPESMAIKYGAIKCEESRK
ncbi:heparin lyase I family protein [Vibrio parahaemolyticus]|nr:heparin lyase I family protein [Vibrio parahaemolyticus]